MDKKMSKMLIHPDEIKTNEIPVEQTERINSITMPYVKSTLATGFAATAVTLVILWIFIVWAATSYDLSIEADLSGVSKDFEDLERANELLQVSNMDLENKLLMLQQQLLQMDKIKKELEECTNVPRDRRFDCHPEDGASESACGERGCCWNPIKGAPLEETTKVPLNTPYCYYPKGWHIYRYLNHTQIGNDFKGFMENYKDSVYKKDIKLIRMEATSIDMSILRVKVSMLYVIS